MALMLETSKPWMRPPMVQMTTTRYKFVMVGAFAIASDFVDDESDGEQETQEKGMGKEHLRDALYATQVHPKLVAHIT